LFAQVFLPGPKQEEKASKNSSLLALNSSTPIAWTLWKGCVCLSDQRWPHEPCDGCCTSRARAQCWWGCSAQTRDAAVYQTDRTDD